MTGAVAVKSQGYAIQEKRGRRWMDLAPGVLMANQVAEIRTANLRKMYPDRQFRVLWRAMLEQIIDDGKESAK